MDIQIFYSIFTDLSGLIVGLFIFLMLFGKCPEFSAFVLTIYFGKNV